MKNFIPLIAIFAFLGCAKTQYGPPLKENGYVVDTYYTSGSHGSISTESFNSGGKISIGVGDLDIPPQYAVIMKTKHGQFVIDDQRAEPLWKSLFKGDKIMVTYCERFRIFKGETNYDGLHFISAYKINTQP